jgi:hypothetical protein
MSLRSRTVFLSWCLLAATAAQATAQANSSAAVDAAVEAIHHVQMIAPGPILLVHARGADTVFVTAVAAKLGIHKRSRADSDACVGDVIPQCPWRFGRDSVVVRLQLKSVSPTMVAILVESWGSQPASPASAERHGFYDRRLLEFSQAGGKWSLSKKTVLFQT